MDQIMDQIMDQTIDYEVICDKNMMLRFLEKYSGTMCNPIDLTESCEYIMDKKLSSTFYNVLTKVLRSGIWKRDDTTMSLDGNTYKIGSTVSVLYYPYSQKYIDYYHDQRFIGNIIFIDKESDNALFIVTKLPSVAIVDDSSTTKPEIIESMKDVESSTIIVRSLECTSSHFLGISRCYTYYMISV